MTFFTVVPMDFTIEMVKYIIFMDIRATLATLPIRIFNYFFSGITRISLELRILDIFQGWARGSAVHNGKKTERKKTERKKNGFRSVFFRFLYFGGWLIFC